MATKTPKWDSAQRTAIYDRIKSAVNDAMGDDGIMVSDGLAYELGADETGTKRVATVKVIIKSADYTIDDVLAEVEERDLKAKEKADAKAKADAKKKKPKATTADAAGSAGTQG